jgi:Cdc6-like AAA superfamily ATPase
MSEIEYQPGFKNKITLKELYSNYKSYCNEFGNKCVSHTKFGDRLRKLGYTVERASQGYLVDFQ